jgi:hypothetical protein
MREPQRGDDILTTFMGGCLLTVVMGIILISTLAVIFS